MLAGTMLVVSSISKKPVCQTAARSLSSRSYILAKHGFGKNACSLATKVGITALVWSTRAIF